MTVDEVKSALRFEARMIQTYRERIEQLRGGSIGSQVGGTPVQGGAADDRVSRAVCEIMRLEGLQREHEHSVWEKYLVHLDTPAQRGVFKARYIFEWRGWDDVALKMKYSTPHVKKLHGHGLILIAEKVSSLHQGLA